MSRDVYRRYFKVTEGPLVEEVKKAMAINEQARVQYGEILKSIGAKDAEWLHRNHTICGVMFDKNPDLGVYKKVKGSSAWWPKQNCKEGRELLKKLDAVKTHNMKDCLKVIDLDGNFPRILGGNRVYYAQMVEIPGNPLVIFVVVPWFDVDTAELERYKTEKSKGIAMHRDMDAILWEPTKDMIEVKHWQVEKEIEEYNAIIRQSA